MKKKKKGVSHWTLLLGGILLIVGTLFGTTFLQAQPSPDVSLELLLPHGGEYWGGNQTILWNSTDVQKIDIWFSEDGGSTWTQLAHDIFSLDLDPKVWQWDTTLVNDTVSARINISSTAGYGHNDTGVPGYGGDFNPTLYYDLSDSTFTVDNTPPSIIFVNSTPDVQEAGEDIGIVTEIVDNVGVEDVFLSIMYPDSRQENISITLNQTGVTYSSHRPYFTVGTHTYSIWATDRSGNDVRSQNESFLIQDTVPPEVYLIYPVGGEFISGTEVILWEVTDNSDASFNGTIYLQYSDDGGTTWYDLAEKINNSGIFYWNTTTLMDGVNYRVRVNATDEGGNSGFAETNMSFTLDNTAPLVTLKKPVGGEYLSGLISITWTATDTLTLPENLRIDISYSANNGSSWQKIAENISNTGLFGYSTHQWPDGDMYLIRVNATDETGNRGYDIPTGFLIKDTKPPSLSLFDPQSGYLYIVGRKLFSLSPLETTIIIGGVTVHGSSNDDISQMGRIEIYVDSVLREISWTPSYSWMWWDTFGLHTLEVIAIDNAGNTKAITRDVFVVTIPLDLPSLFP